MTSLKAITREIGALLSVFPPAVSFAFAFRGPDKGGVGIVAQRLGGGGSVQIVQLEVRIALETTVSIKFKDFGKGQGSLELFVGTGRVDGLVGAFGDGRKEAVDLFFFGWWFERIVVSNEATDFLKPVDMTGDVGAVDMSEIVNEVSERFLTLFRETFLSIEKIASRLPSIGEGSFGNVGSGGTFPA